MADFQALQSYLLSHADELRLLATDPEAYDRQMAGLQQYWSQDGDDGARLAETLQVVGDHPDVQRALAAAGLIAEPEVAPPAPSGGETPAARGAAAARPASTARTAARPAAPELEAAAVPAAAAAPAAPSGAAAPVATPASSPRVQDQLAVWDKKTAIGKEILTGCIGLMIVGMTLFVALIAVLSARNATVFAAAKDVLIVLTGLVGVVLGYYFGRMPADARAEQAQSEANAAQSALDTTKATIQTILEEPVAADQAPPAAVTRGLESALTRGAGVSAAGGLTEEQVRRIRNALR